MKERPILFSGPMVRAILAGTKSQTRRIVRPMPGRQTRWMTPAYLCLVPAATLATVDGRLGAQWEHPRGGPGGWTACPFGVPGDRLWVRETWCDTGAGIEYRASHDCGSWEDGCPCNPDGDGSRSEWRPSIHMPRGHSRITLDVTDVRIERLQAITEEDARAEGVTPFFETFPRFGRDQCLTTGERAADAEHRAGFAVLWDEINGARATWKSNPWVFVISFRRVDQ